jgi:hypothetical protein
MSERARIRQAELTRIFKAAKAAGVRAIIRPDGTIEMLADAGPAAAAPSEWDDVLESGSLAERRAALRRKMLKRD